MLRLALPARPTRLIVSAFVLAILLAVPPGAFAQNAKIEVDAEDSPLTIRGVTGDAAGFQGTMRLTATGNVGTFRTLFSDLRVKSDPSQTIGRSQLSLVGAKSMSDGDVIDARVKVDGVADPGSYEGQVELIPAGQKRANATKVLITLDATVRPVLTPVPGRDKVTGALAQCGPMGCGITGFLLPGDAGPDERAVSFTLGKSQTAKVTAIDVFAQGEKNQHQLTSDELGLQPPYESANGVLSITTKIDPGAVGADHYVGTMNLHVDDVDAPVSVPIDFSVRREPLAAILVLVFGIALGLATKLIRGDGAKLLALYRRAAALERRVNASSVGDKEELLGKIASARQAIAANDSDTATSALKAVETALGSELPAARALPAPGGTADEQKGPFYRREGFLKLASFLLGLAAVVVLAFTGFQTQYIDKSTAFGSADIWDFIALLAWGFAAGLAGRAASSLGGSTGTAQ